jgi:putative glutamine amidotransferase
MKTFYSHLEDWPAGGMVKLFNNYGLKQVRSPQDADVIIWNGGEDIATSIYGEQPVSPGIPLSPSERDTQEIAMFKRYAGNPNKLLVGICRGSQLLNCLNGGTLYQDVNNHSGSHPMFDITTGEAMNVTSTHHQQMRAGPNATIIGVANMSTVKNSGDGVEQVVREKNIKFGKDLEIVWYQKTHTLCIQGHPEYVPESRFAQYCGELLHNCWKQTVVRARNAAFA